jgi:hypothetical protein
MNCATPTDLGRDLVILRRLSARPAGLEPSHDP